MTSFSVRNTVGAAVALTLASLGPAACDSPLSSDARPLTIYFTTRSPAANSASAAASFNNSAHVADSVVLTKAQLVIREIELETAAGPDCGADDDGRNSVAQDRRGSNSGSGDHRDRAHDEDDDDCVDIELDPVLIDLPLNNQIQSRFVTTIPEGQFREIELRIDKPEDDDSAGRAFIARNPTFKDFSVLAEGTFGGKPFRFLARVRARLEFEFRPPLAVRDASTNITVRVLVGRWFRTADGRGIDPATAVEGGPNSALVVSNIRTSIQAFSDSDRDGDER